MYCLKNIFAGFLLLLFLSLSLPSPQLSAFQQSRVGIHHKMAKTAYNSYYYNHNHNPYGDYRRGYWNSPWYDYNNGYYYYYTYPQYYYNYYDPYYYYYDRGNGVYFYFRT